MTHLQAFFATVTAVALATFAAQSSSAVEVPDVAAWRLLAETPPFPPVIRVPLGVYDPVRQRVLVVDGDWWDQPLFIHVFDPAPSPHWSTLAVLGEAPRQPYLPAIVHDPVRDRLVILSGWPESAAWAVTLSGVPAWQQLATTGVAPDRRSGQSAIYDAAHDRIIVFGGVDGGYPQRYLSDAWELSLATDTWRPLLPDGAGPGGREGHGVLYDPVRQRMLVFGGHYEAGTRGFWNDLWQLSLGAAPEWTELQPAGPLPGARSAFGTIYDPIRRRMLVHGGINSNSGIEPDDLWELSLDGSPKWTPISPASTLRGRSYPVDVYDPASDALLACGGGGYPQVSELSLATPVAWRAVLPQAPLASLGARVGHAVVRDSRRGQFTVLGGRFSSVDSTLWSYDPSASNPWVPLSSLDTPDFSYSDDRHVQAAVYDSLDDRLLVRDWGRIWSTSGTGKGEWTLLAPEPPRVDYFLDNVGWDAGLSVDSHGRRLIVTGGLIPAGHAAVGTTRGVWTVPLDGGENWTLLGSLPQTYGSAMHASFEDPIRNRLILVGGIWNGGQFQVRRDYGPTVWVAPLDAGLAWTDLSSTSGVLPPGPPTARAAFDVTRNRLFVFAYSNVWVRDVEDTGPWTELEFTSPRPVVSSAVRHDPERDQVVALFANRAGSANVQAWALTYGPPTARLIESTVSPRAIALTWDSPAAIGRRAVLERRDHEAAWTEQATLTFDDFGLATSTDNDVVAERRYDYRIRIAFGTESWSSAPVTILVPPSGSLALLAPSPNPALRELRVAFHLPAPGPARVEAYDVNGRLCASREVGALGPGTHTIALGGDGRLRPGVYWIRLRRGNEARSARIVLVR